MGFTEGCDFSGCKRNEGAVVALIGSFRNEAVAALSTAKRSNFRAIFNPFAPNFGCYPTGSVGTLGSVVASSIYTVVFRYIRNRNNILGLGRRFIRRVTGVNTRGSVLITISRIRANGNEANGCFTCVGCNVAPSVISATGKLTNNLPVNTILFTRGLGSAIAPNSRNSAFNKGPVTTTNTVDVIREVSSGFLGRITTGNSCVESCLNGVGNIGSVSNVKLVLNVRARGPTGSVTTRYLREKLLILATGAGVELLPTLGVDGGRLSGKLGVLGRIVRG